MLNALGFFRYVTICMLVCEMKAEMEERGGVRGRGMQCKTE